MIDISLIKRDVKVILKDGTDGVVKGSYLSSDGFVLRVQQGTGIVTRNVPLKEVSQVLAPEREEIE